MSRLDLHEKLCDFLGTNYAYFQPPTGVRLNYPCFVYSRTTVKVKHADGIVYIHSNAYQVTYIHRDADSDMTARLLENLPYCSFDRSFNTDELIHDVFIVYD